MILQKWNYEKRDYEDYEIPNEWNVKTYNKNMEEIINCCQCGKKLLFGDSYTSLEVHTEMGFGYSVCGDCYEKEWKRRERYNAKYKL